MGDEARDAESSDVAAGASGIPGLRELFEAGGGITPSLSPLVEAIADQLEGERVAIATAILEAVQREIPEYTGAREAPGIEEVRANIEVLIYVFARILRSGFAVSAEEWEFFRQLGTQRAEQGFPLSPLVSAFDLGMNVGWEYVTQRAHVPDSPEGATTIMSVALQLLHFVNEVTRTITEAYLAATPRRATAERAADLVVSDFLSGALTAEDDFDPIAATFRAGLDHPHAILLVACTGDHGPPPADPETRRQLRWVKAAEVLVRRVENALPIAVVPKPVPHATVLVGSNGSLSWPDLLSVCGDLGREHAVTILAVAPLTGASAIYDAYIEARDWLPLARRVVQRRGHVAQLDDLRIYGVLEGRPGERSTFLRDTLGAVLELPENRRKTMIESLEAWYAADGVVDEAARRLFVHPNTLRYRLRRLQELTGLSLRLPSHQAKLDLALHLLHLSAVASDS